MKEKLTCTIVKKIKEFRMKIIAHDPKYTTWSVKYGGNDVLCIKVS